MVRPKAHDCCLFCPFPPPPLAPGLTIYIVRGLWNGTAEIAAVVFAARTGWQFMHFENEVRKPGILQVASSVNLRLMAFSRNHANLAEIGVRKEERTHAETQFKLREWSGENCVN